MRVPKSYFALTLYCLCPLTGVLAQELTSAETQALRSAPQGSVLTLSNIWSHQRDLPRIPLEISDVHGPQLLLSDKPEYFQTGNGISLQEEAKPGLVRLYIYHVPQPDAGPKTISAVIQNLGKHPLKFRFLRRAFPKPSRDYHLIGKTGLIQFFDSHPDKTFRRIPPGGRMVIDPDMDATTVTTDELVHGLYEFKINQPARISVFERDPGQSSIAVLDQLPKLPRDLPGYEGSGAGRGLFLTSDYDVSGENGFAIDTINGPMRLLLADGRKDAWVRGRDSIAGLEDGRDSGNYGVIYRVRLKYRSGDGRGLALFITKPGRGGRWCGGQAGAVKVSRGTWPEGTVAVPTGRVAFGNPGEMVFIQKFPPLRKGKTGTLEIVYSPPGASCIPTPMLLVPFQP
ncbi:MAG TPA: hypothetical protein VFB72_00735 [Verrucomicrobiae bacterium]|nr:hypothetical protein [Verrucomicrobiae bacterium]